MPQNCPCSNTSARAFDRRSESELQKHQVWIMPSRKATHLAAMQKHLRSTKTCPAMTVGTVNGHVCRRRRLRRVFRRIHVFIHVVILDWAPTPPKSVLTAATLQTQYGELLHEQACLQASRQEFTTWLELHKRRSQQIEVILRGCSSPFYAESPQITSRNIRQS